MLGSGNCSQNHLGEITSWGNLRPGDAREMADEPWHPEKYTAATYCYGVNYVLYTMTY